MLSNQTAFLKPTGSATKILYSAGSEQIMFFVRRFIQNVDWVMDLLALTDKLLRQAPAEITRFERLIIQDYLHFRLVETADGLMLLDRAGHRFEAAELLMLRDQILSETETRALYLYHNPSKHPMARAFKQVLAKVNDKELSEEEVAILREAFLLTDKGSVYTLRSRKLTPPSRSQRWIWKLTCPM
jgi:hypothetical protein